jgi:hypothetical protein
MTSVSAGTPMLVLLRIAFRYSVATPVARPCHRISVRALSDGLPSREQILQLWNTQEIELSSNALATRLLSCGYRLGLRRQRIGVPICFPHGTIPKQLDLVSFRVVSTSNIPKLSEERQEKASLCQNIGYNRGQFPHNREERSAHPPAPATLSEAESDAKIH